MSPSVSAAVLLGFRFPRVSGDEPLDGILASLACWFSPRERG